MAYLMMWGTRLCFLLARGTMHVERCSVLVLLYESLHISLAQWLGEQDQE
jgi:hypothetical protein